MSSISNNNISSDFSGQEVSVDKNQESNEQVAEDFLSRVANERLNPELSGHQEQLSLPLPERDVSARGSEENDENTSQLWKLIPGGMHIVSQGLSSAYNLGAKVLSETGNMAAVGVNKSYDLGAEALSYFYSRGRSQEKKGENDYERAVASKANTSETQNSIVRTKHWDFVTQKNITALGDVDPERGELEANGRTLWFTRQCISDWSRGEEGDQDVRIGRGVREDLGGHVPREHRDYRENYAWLAPTLARIHDLTGNDSEMTFRVTAFTNQRCLNKLFYNMQGDLYNEFGIMAFPDQRMSWEVQKIPNPDSGEENVVVIAHISGSFPYAADRDNHHLVYSKVGEYKAGLTVNLTENKAYAYFRAELSKEILGKKD